MSRLRLDKTQKMKKLITRLVLKRETLQTLNASEPNRGAGGKPETCVTHIDSGCGPGR
jgi:hypothetical protein